VVGKKVSGRIDIEIKIETEEKDSSQSHEKMIRVTAAGKRDAVHGDVEPTSSDGAQEHFSAEPRASSGRKKMADEKKGSIIFRRVKRAKKLRIVRSHVLYKKKVSINLPHGKGPKTYCHWVSYKPVNSKVNPEPVVTVTIKPSGKHCKHQDTHLFVRFEDYNYDDGRERLRNLGAHSRTSAATLLTL
jgi:hypothetical protein